MDEILQELNDALLVSSVFLTQITDQLDIDEEDTVLNIHLKRKDGEQVLKAFTLLEALEKGVAAMQQYAEFKNDK